MRVVLGSSGGNVKVVMRLDPLSLFWYILMLLMLVSVILRLMHERKMRRLRIEEPKVVTVLRCDTRRKVMKRLSLITENEINEACDNCRPSRIKKRSLRV